MAQGLLSDMIIVGILRIGTVRIDPFEVYFMR